MSVESAPPHERRVRVNGRPCRVWEKGDGPPLGFLAGFGGLPRWPDFCERLSRTRRVVAPSLPGFPGAEGHDRLDDLPDWIAATLDLLEGAGLEGADLCASSVGGMLAAEVAAFCRPAVGRLALLSPLGLFQDEEPALDVFARLPHRLPEALSADPGAAAAFFAAPADADPIEWQIQTTRAHESAARLLWPLGERGLAKRLHRISAPTLLVWGAEDRVLPASYAKRLADGIAGETRIVSVPGAGHLSWLDRPDAVAEAVLAWLDPTA